MGNVRHIAPLIAEQQPTGVVEAASLEAFLDQISERLVSRDNVHDAILALKDGLTAVRRSLSPAKWDSVKEEVTRHPLRQLVHQDPFTRRAYEKPRGYPGDAVVLDFIYGTEDVSEALDEATPLGREIYDACMTVSACCAVRNRRDLIAGKIDEMTSVRSGIRVLSVACGHLREAALSEGFRAGNVGTYFALDKDKDSIDFVKDTYRGTAVESVVGSVRGLISRDVCFENLDFIYAGGLYDYLSDKAAIALTQVLFSMLSPGGKLILANFVPELADIGYMETYMGWQLIYRRDADMERIARTATDATTGLDIFMEPSNSVVFAEITK